jgi:hypothetical protein
MVSTFLTFTVDDLRFHPRSVLLLESYQAASTLHPFDMFGLGEAAWSDQHQSPGEEVSFLKLPNFARK